MKLNPTVHAKISNNQLLQLPEFKYSPFRKTLIRALGLSKDRILETIPPQLEKRRILYNNNDILNDYNLNRVEIPELETTIPQSSLNNYNKNIFNKPNYDKSNINVYKENKFKDYKQKLEFKKEREKYLYINNYYLKEEDLMKQNKDQFDDYDLINDYKQDDVYLGNQNISFYYFCKIMRVFGKYTRPEIKIKCCNYLNLINLQLI